MIKKIHHDNFIILKNLSFLSILRFVNIGVKFLLVAYLVRVLGNNNYGILTWTDSVIQYFLIFINFGFNVYAAKYIVNNNKSITENNKTISAIYTIKGIMFLSSILIVYLLTLFDPFQGFKELLFLMLLMAFGEIFFPIWFFQGVENLGLATYITVFAKIFLVVTTLYFVTQTNDLLTHIYLLVVSSILMGFLGLLVLIFKFKFKFVFVNYKIIIKYIKEASMFFTSNFLSMSFNIMTIFIIGTIFPMDKVAGFDVALKIVLVFIIPFDMLQQAVYPTITRTKNKIILKKILITSIIIGLLFSLLINIFSQNLIQLFGGKSLIEYHSVLKVLSFIPPIVAITFILGTCTLVAFGYQKQFNNSLIFASLFYFLILLALYFSNHLSFWNLVYLRVFADIFLAVIRIVYVKKYKIL